jgi:sugar phosphate isomerase/epimerase
MIPHMEKYGVNVLIENSCEANMKGKYFPMTGEDMNAFIDALDHPMFGACWDTGHANVQRVNMHDELVTLGKNLKALHVHDNNGYGDQHLPPFEGNLNFDCLMQGIIDSGYDGYFTFEVESYNPPNLELKKQGLTDLYNSGKKLLDKYGIYEK